MNQMKSVIAADGTELWFATHGDSRLPAILLGPHFYASFGRTEGDDTQRWIDGLKQEFFVIVADYPRGMGRTGNPLGMEFTADVAAEEYARIADAAGVDRFGWVGYSYGAAIGLQVACRSGRVSALAIGGFPPLNAPFRKMVEVTTRVATTPQPGWDVDPKVLWTPVGFYSSLLDWPEREAVQKLEMPRLVFVGTEDEGVPNFGIDISLANDLRNAEPELTSMGWQIEWIQGRDHMTAIEAAASLPAAREFLRRSLVRG
jgi:pimeloyl-ACP methyl ester carboxylesterase